MIFLEAKKVVKKFANHLALDKVDIEVPENSIYGLLGPNGAGKTTTFYMTTGIIRPDKGRVLLDGEDITQCPMYVRARKGVGYLPQETSVFKKLTVKENIMAILEFSGLTKNEQEKRSDMLLGELGISHIKERTAGLLSGGERRRLEISRSLATNPLFILMDEPFAGIDPLAVTEIKNIIFHLKKRGIGVLISDHNVRETLGACDHAYILNEGEVIETGPPEKIAKSETARRIYLGKVFRL